MSHSNLYDLDAERAVIGCAVATHRGWGLAAGRLGADAFYQPDHQRIFTVCAGLSYLDGTDIDTTEQRTAIVAHDARVNLADLRTLVDERPVMWDRSGGYAARVAARQRTRALMATCSDIFNRLAEGEPLEELLAERPELGALARRAS